MTANSIARGEEMQMTRLAYLVAGAVALSGCGGSSASGLTMSGNSSAAGAPAGGSPGGGAGGQSTATLGGAGGAPAAAGSTSSGGTSSVAGSSSGAGATSAGGGSSFAGTGLHVVGSHFEDNGKTVRLIGWNRPGGEYSCIGDKPTVFDGPTDLASIQAMQGWKGFNAVRLPLNETCWLGINGVNGAASGSSYITGVQNYVSLFRSNGIYVIVEMHWNAPGTFVASSQLPMADADHGVDFWKAVAAKFKGDPGVVFDLYNEPHLNSTPKGGFVAGGSGADPWSCWLNGGCTITPQTWEQQTGGYVVAGMQPMLDAVRGTGATNVVLAGGLNWAGDLSGWAAHAPHDTASNLAASAHVYYKPENCMGAACYSTLQDFSMDTQIPIVTGEVGEFDCAHTFLDSFMAWADMSGVSYLAWSWSLEPCGSPGPSYSAGPSLITDWNGTPTAYGQGFKDHLATLVP
jgi:endoglucanase